MKICFITSTVFSLGGVQRVVSVLANEFSKYYQVDILCANNNIPINRDLYNLRSSINVKVGLDINKKSITNRIYSKIIRRLNEKISIINKRISISSLKDSYYSYELQCKLEEYINLNEYDLVIGVEGNFSVLLGMISHKINAKTIGWQHNSYDAYFNNIKKYYWKQDRLFKQYIPNLDGFVVLTQEDKNNYKTNMNIECKTIYNPLSFKSNLKSTCSKKNILFVGRLVEKQKGLDLLIKSFKKVSKKRKGWQLTIVGEGEDKEKLIELINKEELKNIIKIEPFTNNVEKYYLDSSIFVSTSRWEGFGLVIIEAMECGVPVIAFDNSGPKEIIRNNKIEGILVSKGDTDKFAEKIIELIDDDKLRKEISKNAIRRATDFDINNIVNEWKSLLYNILSMEGNIEDKFYSSSI